MKEYIYKLEHVPTGLFYCSRKGRFFNDITNLSKKGNFYESEKTARKVLDEDCRRAAINEAQVKAHNLDLFCQDSFCFCKAKKEDFKLKKYILKEVPVCAI